MSNYDHFLKTCEKWMSELPFVSTVWTRNTLARHSYLKAAEEYGKWMNKPTAKQIDSVCLSYDHSFGLMAPEQKDKLREEVKEIWWAFYKEYYE